MQAVKDTINGATEKVLAHTPVGNAKIRQLNGYVVDNNESTPLTTYWGTKMDVTDKHVNAGERGPAVLNDFHAREKITKFDHERIPERVIHARGAAAHGTFRLHTAIPELTKAKLFTDTTQETPIFIRFSTVQGSKGSADSVRDVRGFAVRFYTQEGNYDIVGNNIPIFFIQQSIQFPDLVHAVKPDPAREMPQAQTAHDNAWDFMGLNDASAAMMCWIMSDRTIPRSYRMMQGFGVHTWRLINAEGKRHFVKFHWTPQLGTHSLVWDEALKLAGQDPDFHRRDLYNAIDAGAYPKWDFGVQIVSEEDEHNFDFDLLDSTKIIPEDEVPVQYIGELELNKNVDNYFAETEQVAFCTSHIIPGIDFTDDPLLAWRNHSYVDTQISRLGINYDQIPINQPVCPFAYNHRDGQHRMSINTGLNYYPNRKNHAPPSTPEQGAWSTSKVKVAEGIQDRIQGPKFNEHYNQATLFYNSLSEPEKEHFVSAVQFELGKCDEHEVQQRIVDKYNIIDHDLAVKIASAFGDLKVPDEVRPNHGKKSAFLSQVTGKNQRFTASGRQVGIFILPGFSQAAVTELKTAFLAAGVIPMIVGPVKGSVESGAASFTTQFTFETCRSTHFDALIFIGPQDDGNTEYIEKLRKQGRLRHAATESYFHKKPIMFHGKTVAWGADIALPGEFTPSVKEGSDIKVEKGVMFVPNAGFGVEMIKKFMDQLAQHRVWDRETSHIAA